MSDITVKDPAVPAAIYAEAVKVVAGHTPVLAMLIAVLALLFMFRSSIAGLIKAGGFTLGFGKFTLAVTRNDAEELIRSLLADAQSAITAGDYSAFARVRDSEGSTVGVLFPSFEKDGPLHNSLRRLRRAYLIRSPDGSRIRPERRLVLTSLGRLLNGRMTNLRAWFEAGTGSLQADDDLDAAQGAGP